MTHPSSGNIARPDPAAEAGGDAEVHRPAAPPPGTAEALAAGRHDDPFSVLGPHPAGGGHVVRAWLPGAERAVLRCGDGRRAPMERSHEAGLFAVGLGADPGAYRIEAARGAATWEVDDPYRFAPLIGEMDEHLISEGTHLRLWEVLGARTTTHQGVSGTAFAVWAPNAERVSVIGPFNDWDGRRHPMRRRGASGVWEIFLPGIGAGERYKYEIIGPGGELLPPKADPVGRASERRPDNCSVVPAPAAARPAGDAAWRAGRGARVATDAPVSIYEVHLGSWRRGEGGRWLTYEELADRLVAHVKGMGFTHIELLPVTEHPFDGSWGYQPVGLYAPTRRFGPPEAFHAFIDACHAAGIGVILDWVPAHFPSDPHGLGRFDGTHLYEHSDPREGFHRDWNTLIYNFGRREVQNFLVANALYWTQEMGIDGLRVDAVASMLYRDYSREDGEWVPNRHGGRENLEAIDFLRRMNAQVYGADPSLVTIAEESTAWPGVSRPVHHGGLGFGYKWNMGWMHDTLDYMGRDPMYRRHHHGLMSFGLHYAFSENFVLPLSHDEVVHGKGSILGRMPGDRWQKFANLRAYYAFMYAHPGKKLLFMGQEFGQESEWNHDAELPWDAFREPLHEGVSALVHDLNRLYRDRPALHRRDCREDGFEWIDGAAEQASVYAWTRRGEDGDPPVLCVFNFSGVEHTGWRLGVPRAGRWAEVLNSDATVYGGAGRGNMGGADSGPVEAHGRPDSIVLTLPPLTGIILEHRP